LLQLQELLINSDQREFGIPMRVNKHPTDEPGTRIREWMIVGSDTRSIKKTMTTLSWWKEIHQIG
jgi:hypothetical protein